MRHHLGTFLWTRKVQCHCIMRDCASMANILYQAIKELQATGKFSKMNRNVDEDEHSLEMHLPYVRKIFEGYAILITKPLIYSSCIPHSIDISIVPIMVGAIDKIKEAAYGHLLAPYLAREDTFCVVSSDFCHWCASRLIT